MKRLTNKIIKVCGFPEDYVYEYFHGASCEEEKIRRLKDYVACVKRVEKEFNKKK